MRRALIACGGTGGHLSPGIALAEEMISRGWECELLISTKQVDSRLVRKYSSLDYTSIPGSPPSLNPVRFARFAYNLVQGFLQCMVIIRQNKPDVVIGFGGFLSMAALFAGRVSGLPVAIHDSNRIAGRVTRTVSLFAHRIYLPEGVRIKTAHSSRIRPIGVPIRREIHPISKNRAKRHLGLNPSMKLLVVFGGSQGASALNEWVKSNIDSLAQEEIQVYCLMGITGGSNSELSYRSRKGTLIKSIFRQFSDEMGVVLSAADLVVSRAGTGSLTEIARCRAPTITIPYPFAADNHQYYNARHFEMHGCGILIEQEYIGNLLDEVKDTIYNDWLLQRFRENLSRLDDFHAQTKIVKDLEELILEMEARALQTQARKGESLS